MPYAVDPEAADRLWTLSEQVLGFGASEARSAHQSSGNE
jgi:hypothetical protein